MLPLSLVVAVVLILPREGYWASPTPASSTLSIVPQVWTVQDDERRQAKLLCLLQGMSGADVSIWFSNGNGTNVGTFQVSNQKISQMSTGSRDQQHLLSSPSHSKGLTDLLSTSSSHPRKAFSNRVSFPPTGEGLSVFSTLTLPSDELSTWGSVTCFVAELGSSRLWRSPKLSLPGDAEDDACPEEEATQDSALHVRTGFLQLLSLRIMTLKVLTFDLLVTCALILQTRREVSHQAGDAS
ncbi:uncharacterized protein LOC128483813 [Spea bombifrons]|uniref:uncharacterized protein LOC128483813 n=1 Tax=Spea bombifrons TaxID=233779 RepID=UPI00234B9BD4|nr:uncharacterized protein LOC128483813 [Spea bombifrons]